MEEKRRNYKYRQVKFYLNEKEYARLKEMAGELGMTPAALAKKIVLGYLGLDETLSLVERIRNLEERYERIVKELGRIEKDLAYVMRIVKLKRGSS